MSKNHLSMKKSQIAEALVASAVLALALFFVVAPAAHADDFGSSGGSGGYDGGSDTFGSSGGSYGYSSGSDTFSSSGGSYGYDGGCCGFSYAPIYDGGYYGYAGGYGYYGGSSYSLSYGGGYGSWGYRFPFSSLGGGSSISHTVINSPTTIVTNNPAPQTVVYVQPSYPVYPPVYNTPVYIPFGPAPYDICPNIAGIQASLPTGYYMQNGNCFYTANQAQPYVTLAAVPYTGLDLGPVGTAVYWGFLVLWCLIAAYLIAVKKVQNKIVAWFTGETVATTTVAHTASVARVQSTPVQSTHSVQFDGIDPFIQSQIARSN